MNARQRDGTASEMAYWILPAFLVSIGAGPTTLGIIEGVSESDDASRSLALSRGSALDRYLCTLRFSVFLATRGTVAGNFLGARSGFALSNVGMAWSCRLATTPRSVLGDASIFHCRTVQVPYATDQAD